jgi:hypothetical protein
MKTKLVLGMVLVATTMSFSSAFAAETKVETKAAIAAEREHVKAEFFGKDAVKLSAQQKIAAGEKMVDALKLDTAKSVALKIALKHDSAKLDQRTEEVATMLAAKRKADASGDAALKESINNTVNTTIDYLENSVLIGQFKSANGLTSAELADVTNAATKIESLLTDVLTKYGIKERASYVKILGHANDLIATRKVGTFEEALLESVKAEKNFTKEQALDLLRKFKICV